MTARCALPVRLIGVLVILASCQDQIPAPPSQLSLEPAQGPNTQPTQVTLNGRFLFALANVDLSQDAAKLARKLEARLGSFALTGLKVDAKGVVRGAVPSNLMAPGMYDLVVTDAAGRTSTATAAFQVIAGSCSDFNASAASAGCPTGCNAAVGCGCASSSNVCRSICGDGKITADEACDDGNTKDGDGCSAACTIEPNATCTGQPSVCSVPVDALCGNGVLDPGETCDDGNTRDQDGCSHACAVEAGHLCFSTPSLCVAESDVVYASPTARCPGNGSRATPYCTANLAVADGRTQIVLLAGTYSESVDFLGVRRTMFSLDGQAIVTGNGAAAVRVREGSDVRLRNLQLRGTGDGVRVLANARAAIERSTVGPTMGIGISTVAGSSVTVDRSMITRNTGGGIVLQTPRYRVTNSIISRNGSSQGGATAGVTMLATSTAAVFANDTVADNLSGPGTDGSGITCAVAGVRIVNSIVWAAESDSSSIVGTACSPTYSDVQGRSGGTGNFRRDPAFVDQTSYRISAISPCVDAGDPAGVEPGGPAPSRDFTGALRPRGARVDVGAYEVR